jgi:hypothetical protein
MLASDNPALLAGNLCVSKCALNLSIREPESRGPRVAFGRVVYPGRAFIPGPNW